MKSLSYETLEHLSSETITLSTCWKVIRKDGEIFAFTDADIELVIDGLTYIPSTGFTRSAISTKADLSVDNLDLQCILDDESITNEDLMAGIWDFAEIYIFQVNRNDVTQIIPTRRGWLGEVKFTDSTFTVEMRGLAQVLQSVNGQVYSPACRATLGDSRCQVAMSAFTDVGTVESVTNKAQWTDTSINSEEGYYNFGVVTWLTGLNEGLSMEVAEQAAGDVRLFLEMPYAIEVGDTYEISAGCDKAIGTCKNKFNNVVNFRGEPYVPGNDAILAGGYREAQID